MYTDSRNIEGFEMKTYQIALLNFQCFLFSSRRATACNERHIHERKYGFQNVSRQRAIS